MGWVGAAPIEDEARPEKALTDPVILIRLFTLALCVWREARGESGRGKQLVAQTIENRVTDPRWPDTYVEVITQPWQFSAFNKNDPNALLFPKETDPSWAACVRAADAVIAAAEPFTMANHYVVDALRPRPAWFDDAKIVNREGAHVFLQL